jgi:aspartate dehydrogenase
MTGTTRGTEKTVAIGGLGAVGLPLARALDAGIPGLRLVAVSARDEARARDRVGAFRAPPAIVAPEDLAQADIVVEAAPAAVLERIALPAIEAARTLVIISAGALLPRMHLIDRARETGARIVVPTGGLVGFDAVRAAAEGNIASVTIETRKPPGGLAGAPYLVQNNIDLTDLKEPRRVFAGNAFAAAQGFPANVNVAAALALAGIGPERTMCEIWADPGVTRNTHHIRVEADSTRLNLTIESVPSEENPRTGKIVPLSVIACLRAMTATLHVGT